jgi:hypothetical protein
MRVHLTFAAATAATILLSASLEAQSRGTRGGATQAGAARSAEAQTPGWMPMELGVDGEFAFQMSDPHATMIGLPVSQIRAAFMKNPTWSIEPALSFNYLGADGGSANAAYVGVGALYHFSTDRSHSQWYARPFIGLDHTSEKFDVAPGTTQTVSSNRFGVGGGFGVKMPIASRLGARYEANLSHFFEGGSAASSTKLGFMAGLSFYTR